MNQFMKLAKVYFFISMFIGTMYADVKNYYGTYVKNGLSLDIQYVKPTLQYSHDLVFSFKGKECDMEAHLESKEIKNNKFVYGDNQGYGFLLYMKGAFDKEKLTIEITRKYLSDIGVPTECVQILSGTYKKNTSSKTTTNSTNRILKISDEEYLNYKQTNPLYDSADRELNNAFRMLQKSLSDTDKKKLKIEQNEWIKSRDELLSNIGEKGSKLYIDALIQMTRERTQYLKNSL